MRLILARCGIVLLVICLLDCSAWQATQSPLLELEGKKVRITTKSGDKGTGVLVDADSLGFTVLKGEREFKNRYYKSAKPNLLEVDTTTISMVEHRVHSSARTLALVMSGLLVLGLAADLVVMGITNLPE